MLRPTSLNGALPLSAQRVKFGGWAKRCGFLRAGGASLRRIASDVRRFGVVMGAMRSGRLQNPRHAHPARAVSNEYSIWCGGDIHRWDRCYENCRTKELGSTT